MRGLVCGLVLMAASAGVARAAPAVDYGQPSSWLCRPGRDDVCSRPLLSTAISPADGAATRKTSTPDPAAPIDCFYVYPTVSREPAANADMAASPEVEHAAAQQFARFAGVCRPFAPIYRQTTVAAMNGQVQGADSELAYDDVRAAWRAYLAKDNHGRGVVLVGHSQGSSHLTRLISEEIDGKPDQRLLVSAIIPGANIQVRTDGKAGGEFPHIPPCRSAVQTGCVIGYSTFLASDPPGPKSYFGRSLGPGLADLCVNPGELIDHGALDSVLPTTGRVAEVLGTPLVENSGLASAACTTSGDRTFLAISVPSTGAGAATLERALEYLDSRGQGWGLHPLDINLTLGDLVEIVSRQGHAWGGGRQK